MRFFNSKNIVVKFETEDLDKSFLCGEQHRRADSHLDRVVARSGYPFPGKQRSHQIIIFSSTHYIRHFQCKGRCHWF